MRKQQKSLFRRLVDSCFTEEELEGIRALPTRQNEYGYDPFGFHRDAAKPVMLAARALYKHYFRVKTHGVENVPSGRVMLVANHSGQLPFDGVMIAAAVLYEGTPPRLVRAMLERFVPTLPYVSFGLARCGQVLGTVDNCVRLLEDEEAILVFPEGARGIAKPFSQRYQLQPFGLGFVRMALQTHTPILPVAVIGAEEQAPSFNIKPLAKLFGSPAFPVMPFPPYFPVVPLPVRYHIHFGEARCLTGDPDDDDAQIGELAHQIKLDIELMLRMGLKQRRSVFF